MDFKRCITKYMLYIYIKYVYNYIRPNNTVVDRKLKQLYPLDENIGKIPLGLIEFFNRNER